MRLPNLRLEFDGPYGTTCFFNMPVSDAQVRATKAAAERSFCKNPTHRIGLVLYAPDMETQVILVDAYASAQCAIYAHGVLLRELRDFAKNHDARYEWLNKCAYGHTTYCVSEYVNNQYAEYKWNYRPIENDKHARFGVAISHDQLHNVRFDLDFNYKFLHPFGLIQDKGSCVGITGPFKTNFINAYTCRPYMEAYIRANRIWTEHVQQTIWKLLEYLEKDLKAYYGK